VNPIDTGGDGDADVVTVGSEQPLPPGYVGQVSFDIRNCGSKAVVVTRVDIVEPPGAEVDVFLSGLAVEDCIEAGGSVDCTLMFHTAILTYPGFMVDISFAEESAPTRPSNVWPSDRATGVSLTPTLNATAFSDPDGDKHAASDWQITTTSGDYSKPLFDSAYDTGNLTKIELPRTTLEANTTYYWRVRYWDENVETRVDPDNYEPENLGDYFFQQVFWEPDLENQKNLHLIEDQFSGTFIRQLQSGEHYLQNYSFTYDDMSFVCLDYNPRDPDMAYPGAAHGHKVQLHDATTRWFEYFLARNADRELTVFCHHPFYVRGASQALISRAGPRTSFGICTTMGWIVWNGQSSITTFGLLNLPDTPTITMIRVGGC